MLFGIRVRRVVSSFLLVTCTAVGLSTSHLSGEEIGYIEEFSLAGDRAKALEQLIPGTNEFYYFSCLHLQNTEQYDRVEELLAEWIKRHKVNAQVREIQHRQALLTYDRNPQKSLAYLSQQLSLRFNHQRDTVDRAQQLPTELDAALISREQLTKRALQRHRNNLNGFEDGALDWVAEMTLDAARRRDLLNRLQSPDVEGLPQMVVADLNSRNSRGFGSLKIHQNLLKDQLDECLGLMPALRNQMNFVNTYLTKLQPSADVNVQYDQAARREFLQRLWSFVETLNPTHNSLKAHVLYHQLVLDELQGRYDRDKFIEYMKLPRSLPYINPRYLEQGENRRHQVDMGADFRSLTRCQPIRDDGSLVRRYLQYFFVDDDNYRVFEPYLNDLYLKHLFAETKILSGQGEPTQWYSMLPPDRYQRLKDRVDLEFVRTNPKHFGADEDVTINVDIKNVPNLIVKVYRINALNYYRDRSRQVDTAINLDGLIPNQELSFQYSEPPLRRVRRQFELPSLKKPGLYVVDFIGNGKNSRALLQKGKLRHVMHSTPNGLLFFVFDEQDQLLQNASLWMGGREYQADRNGRILVPFSTQPGRRSMILVHDDTVTLASFNHLSENYDLQVGFYVDRESLLPGRLAQLLVRPGLLLNQKPVSLRSLENISLSISSEDQDGVMATDSVSGVELTDGGDLIHEFRVPPRLKSLSVTLNAEVKSVSENKTLPLGATQTFSVNLIDATTRIEDLHFLQADGQYFLELLGKTGERRSNRPVGLKFKHQDFRNTVDVTLRTNEQGRISLGNLAGIQWLRTRLNDGTDRQWNLTRDRVTHYGQVNSLLGEEISIPYSGKAEIPERGEFALYELRGGKFASDRFEHLHIQDGQLVVRDLEAGDYLLFLKDVGKQIRLWVTEGTLAAGYALGEFRQLEIRNRTPLTIDSIEVDDESIEIGIVNGLAEARVHLLATNYQPAFNVFNQLAKVRDPDPGYRYRVPSSSLYVEGRKIGDEYRYILDRQYAEKFPGNMLPRPQLLLNPWAVRDTNTEQEVLAEDSAFGADAPDAARDEARNSVGQQQMKNPTDESSLDFLAEAAIVELNVKADADGRITIDRSALRDKQFLVVVAVDPLTTAVKSISLPEVPPKKLDLRLANSLEPDASFSQQKQISIISADDPFVVDDIRSGRFQVYDSLSQVFQLYQTLTGDENLEEFRFLLRWDRMSHDEKVELYSKHACHELNFFVSRKDPEFFDKVIQPYLGQKLNKTFLDHYLLGHDLDSFLAPWRYDHLNAVERILLARRIAGEQAVTATSLKNAVDLMPPDPDELDRDFDTALLGEALASYGGFGGLGGVAGGIDAGASLYLDDESADGAVETRGMPAPGAANQANLRALGRKRESASASRDSRRRLAQQMESSKKAIAERFKASAESMELSSEGVAFDKIDNLGINSSDAVIGRLYQTVEQTREWVENNYYQLPIDEQNSGLVTAKQFWVEFAQHDSTQPFYSTSLAQVTECFTEMMFALSVLDLPFQSPEHEEILEGEKLTINLQGPAVVFHQQIQPTTSRDEDSSLLVSQNFFAVDEGFQQEGGQHSGKFVTGEFLIQTVYGCQVVVTNPTPVKQRLDVLVQIPAGAIPVDRGKVTENQSLQLEPYGTQGIQYFFYFPFAGQFQHFPVQVTKGNQLIVSAEPTEFRVVEELSKVDQDSWDYLSQFGTNEQVLEYLETKNLLAVNLERIAFRMSDFDFYQKAITVLRKRHAFNPVLWSYSIKHNEPEQINEYLQYMDSFVSQCGVVLDSPLLKIDPVLRKVYQHMEYRPLVNARAHQVGKQRQILNDRLHAQYHRWLKVLSYLRDISDQDRLSTIYYLLLQDRISDSLREFEQIDPSQLETRMQYDYARAYLGMSQGDLVLARGIADRYAEYPVESWNNAFALITNQLDEIEGKEVELIDDTDRDQVQDRLASAEPTFEFEVETRTIDLSYRNLEQVTVNFYRMDIELLFSRNPFVQQYSGQFSYIQPNMSQAVDLPGDQDRLPIEVPAELRNQNVLVEVVGAGQRQAKAYYSNSLSVQLSENFGQLRVLRQDTGEPLSTTYVKVYSQNHDGSITFYKDGYTDLRGRFDYSTLSENSLENVKRFSILVLHDDAGAMVREADPPTR